MVFKEFISQLKIGYYGIKGEEEDQEERRERAGQEITERRIQSK
jgi:hypothetical protein